MKIEITDYVPYKTFVELELPAYFHGSDSFDSGGGYDVWVCVTGPNAAYYLNVDYNGEWEFCATSNVGQYVKPNSIYTRTTAKVFFHNVDRLQKELGKIPGRPA